MSRFADPTRSDRLVLGKCQCPGTPHDEDWMDIRTQVGAEEVVSNDSIGLVARLTLRWNLLLSDGTVAPIDRDHVGLLFSDTFGKINDWANDHLVTTADLPNASAVRSRATSRANGSRTLKAVKAS